MRPRWLHRPARVAATDLADSWWLARDRQPDPFGALKTDRHTEVAVIGAGFTGLSTALHLAEAGIETVVLEAERVAWGASGRNAGGLSGLWSDVLPRDVETTWGADRGGRMNRAAAEAVSLVRDIIERSGCTVDFRLPGILIAAHDAAAEHRLTELAHQWTRRGNPFAIFRGADASALLRTDRYRLAARIENAGWINPVSYATAIARLAASAGADVFTNSAVHGLNRNGNAWKLRLEAATVTARWVILTNSTFGRSTGIPAAGRSVCAVPYTVLVSHPIDDMGTDFGPTAPLADTNRASPLWLCVTGDRRLVTSVLPTARQGTDAGRLGRAFQRKLRRIYPDAPAIEWEAGWTAPIDLLPGRTPRIFRIGPRLLAPAGYSGQGIAIATALGRELARSIADRDEEASAFAFTDSRPLVGSTLLPVLLRKVVFPGCRFLDRFY